MAPVVTGAVVVCGCAAIAVTNPTDTGIPLCWSRAIFGIDCPLCGGLRCVNELLRGNWLAAADHNVLAAVLLPIATVVWVIWLAAALRGRTIHWRRPSRRAVIGIVAVLAVFTVLRNVGGPAWMDWLGSGTYRS